MKIRKRISFAAVASVAVLAVGLSACAGGADKPSPTAPGKVKIKYGPFNIPDKNSPGKGAFAGFAGSVGGTVHKGSIWNDPVTNIKKPCDNCFITGMTAGLENPDGSNANIHNGLWLHHMVMLNQGKDTVDATCSNAGFSLPHFAVGGTGANTERFFASGNERTPLNPGDYGNYGYKVNTGDKWHMLIDLMNETTTAKDVYITITYDYAPISGGRTHVEPVWLDANQCGTSEVPGKTGIYSVPANPLASTVAGKIVGAGGHLHDGGVNSVFSRNGQPFCTSEAKYGTKPDFIEPGGGSHDGGHGATPTTSGWGMPTTTAPRITTTTAHGDTVHAHAVGGVQHISEQTVCTTNLPTLAKGDQLGLTGNYNTNLHPVMSHDGTIDPVMSIGIMYVAEG